MKKVLIISESSLITGYFKCRVYDWTNSSQTKANPPPCKQPCKQKPYLVTVKVLIPSSSSASNKVCRCPSFSPRLTQLLLAQVYSLLHSL